MNPIAVHQAAVARANCQTAEEFGVAGPYEPGTPEHDFWLDAFDAAFVCREVNP